MQGPGISVPAQHQPGELASAHAAGGDAGRDHPAVFQDGDPVGERQHLVKLVAYQQDGGPCRGQLPDGGVEAFQDLTRQRLGRLVEDEEASSFRVALQRPGDSDNGPVGRRHRGGGQPDIDRAAQFGQARGCRLGFGTPPDQPADLSAGEAANPDVVDHRGGVYQSEVLVYERDAERVQRAGGQGQGVLLAGRSRRGPRPAGGSRTAP